MMISLNRMKSKNSTLSIIASLICIAGILVLNYLLAVEYRHASGKTRGLFGLVELSHINRKLYILPFEILSIIFCIKAIVRKETTGYIIGSISFLLIAAVAFFMSVWRLLV